MRARIAHKEGVLAKVLRRRSDLATELEELERRAAEADADVDNREMELAALRVDLAALLAE